MPYDLSELKHHASALYDILGESKDRKVKSHLRKMIYQLEMMDESATNVPESSRQLAAWLVALCDAEHGSLVKRYPNDPNDTDASSIEDHIGDQKKQLHEGMKLHAKVERGVKHLAGMLGVLGVQDVPVSDQIPWFANVLIEHLREDRDMGEKLHQLAQATMESLQSVQKMLLGFGKESAELQQVALLLSKPMPDNPVQARDYLNKINHNLQHVQQEMIQQSKQAQHEMNDRVQAFGEVSKKLSAVQKQARSDALTGLPNRRVLSDFLMAYSPQESISLAIMDIDQLQAINDLAGEAGGNRCLCEVADMLVARVRDNDMVFRVGGDEFVLVFPGLNVQEAGLAIQNLHDAVSQMKLLLSGQKLQVQASFGLAERGGQEKLHTWIKRADAALYVAKGKGGHRIEVSP